MNDSEGFITLHRKMMRWGWYKDVNTKCLFLHCIFQANWKPAEFKGVKLERGQFATSLPHLAAETGLTVSQVRTAIKHLILTGEIADKSYSKFRVITVIRYDDYQKDDSKIRRHVADKSQASSTNRTKKQRNNNNKKNIAPSEPEEEFVSDIDWTEEENQMSLKSIRDEEE